MSIEQRRKELARLMLQKVNGLELIMARYTELKGHFPSADLTPRQIIERGRLKTGYRSTRFSGAICCND